MRIPCNRPLVVRQTEIGGQLPLVCIPLVSASREALMEEARLVSRHAPDLLEWRADYLEGLTPREVAPLLSELRRIIGEAPLVFTCRSPIEGGHAPPDLVLRMETIAAALESQHADIVDFELDSGARAVSAVRLEASKQRKNLLLSWHNFAATPEESYIKDKLVEAKKQGADIAKVAVMPQHNRDVLTLLSATLAARLEVPDIPIISMSMGVRGAVSRLFGGNFGSDVTFAQGQSASAPGQVPIEVLRSIWGLLP